MHDQQAPTYRRTWQLAWPIILSNSSVPLVGAVDTAVVGHLPEPAYLAAVALGANLFSIIYWAFGFLRMGTTGFVAQAFGRGDGGEVAATVGRALLVAAVLSALIWLLQAPILAAGLAAVDGSIRVEAFTADYYAWRIWSAPAAFANYVVIGTLIGLQRTRFVLLTQLLLNGTNIALDLLFVPVLGLGIAGVALASVLAEYTAVGMGLWLVWRAVAPLPGRADRTRLLDPAALRALLAVNGNILVRTLCLVLSLFYFTAVGTALGAIIVAGNAILMQLQFLLSYGLDGFAHAVESLAGSAHGANRRDHFRAAIRTSTVWALVVAAGYSLLYALIGPTFIDWMTDLPAVRESAGRYLPWLVGIPLIAVWSFQLDGIFIGTTQTAAMRNAMLMSAAAFWALTELLVPTLGNHGLWLAFTLFLVLRAVTLIYYLPEIDRRLSRQVGQ